MNAMETKLISYYINELHRNPPAKRLVTGFAVDHEPKFCVRQVIKNGWTADDWDTGARLISSQWLFQTANEAIETAIEFYKRNAKIYLEKRAMALMQSRDAGLL
jgi:hypothetical protein